MLAPLRSLWGSRAAVSKHSEVSNLPATAARPRPGAVCVLGEASPQGSPLACMVAFAGRLRHPHSVILISRAHQEAACTWEAGVGKSLTRATGPRAGGITGTWPLRLADVPQGPGRGACLLCVPFRLETPTRASCSPHGFLHPPPRLLVPSASQSGPPWVLGGHFAGQC